MELEWLLSEHFGRTPLNTPAASQELVDSDIDSEIDAEPVIDIDERVSHYVDEILHAEHASSSDGENGDEPSRIDGNRLHSANGCGCKSRCNLLFSEEVIYSHILDLREMTKEEKEMYVMGSLNENDRDTTKRLSTTPDVHVVDSYSTMIKSDTI